MALSLEEKVALLFDRTSVQDVVHRFFFALDDKDWQAAGACLTDPFTMHVPRTALKDNTLVGEPVALDAFVKRLEERNGGFVQTLHLHPNPLVSIDGDKAKLRSFMVVPHSVGPEDDDTFWSWGFYEIELVRAGEGWKMARMLIDGRIRNNVDSADIYRRAADRLGGK